MKLGKVLRKIKIESGTVLLVNKRENVDDEWKADLVNVLTEIGISNVGVILVDDVNNIKAISEETLQHMGYVRISRMADLIGRVNAGKEKEDEVENPDPETPEPANAE